MDKLASGLMQILGPFLGFSWVVYRTNCRKGIFLFISNIGDEQVVLGVMAQPLEPLDLSTETRASLVIFETAYHHSHSCGLCWMIHMKEEHLIDALVDFLPLQWHCELKKLA